MTTIMAKAPAAKKAATQRKRPLPNLTQSTAAIVAETATTIWSQLYKPVAGDQEATNAAHKTASDQLQNLFEELRKRRDDTKPNTNARLSVEDVLERSLGKPMSDLQAQYVSINIAGEGEDEMLERVSLPQLKRFAEIETHPYHEAATAFLKENKVRFIEREGKGRGKASTVLESTRRAA